jgi:hypothetical protein
MGAVLHALLGLGKDGGGHCAKTFLGIKKMVSASRHVKILILPEGFVKLLFYIVRPYEVVV